jgi:hypothetical protein
MPQTYERVVGKRIGRNPYVGRYQSLSWALDYDTGQVTIKSNAFAATLPAVLNVVIGMPPGSSSFEGAVATDPATNALAVLRPIDAVGTHALTF